MKTPGRNSAKAMTRSATVSQIFERVMNQPMVPAVKTRIPMVETTKTMIPCTQVTSINSRSVLKMKTKGSATVRSE